MIWWKSGANWPRRVRFDQRHPSLLDDHNLPIRHLIDHGASVAVQFPNV
jgi:hypothetical protein